MSNKKDTKVNPHATRRAGFDTSLKVHEKDCTMAGSLTGLIAFSATHSKSGREVKLPIDSHTCVDTYNGLGSSMVVTLFLGTKEFAVRIQPVLIHEAARLMVDGSHGSALKTEQQRKESASRSCMDCGFHCYSSDLRIDEERVLCMRCAQKRLKASMVEK